MRIERAAPPREDRLKAGTAFCGTCMQLRERLGRKDGGCFNVSSRSFGQSFGCQFTLSLGILNTLRNTVVIVHGPVGCGFWSTAGIGPSRFLKRQRDPSQNSTIWISTNLDESDVISGGEQKLREAVLYADKEWRPEAIVVAGSCVPALIGDDVDVILDQIKKDVSADLVAVNCEGFKTKLMATAYDAVYNGILKSLSGKKIEREKPLIEDKLDDLAWEYRKAHTVNVFNVGTMGRQDELELQRLLNALELEVTFLPCYSRPSDFRRVLDAALNVSICGTHDDYYVRYIYDEYRIPYLIDTMPIGRKGTGRWLMNIAKHFNLEEKAALLVEKEDAALDAALAPYRETLRGKRAYVSGGEIRIFVTAELIMDLGMEIAGLKSHHVDAFIKPVMEDLEVSGDTYINIASQHPFEQVNLIQKLKPDIIVMHSGGGNITAKHGLPVLPLFSAANGYMGYRGAFEVAYRLKRLLANSRFNKNIKTHRPLPYQESWYKKDAAAYIRE
jgi:nitrogenase molybdenum-iron protein alpha chain